MISNEDEGIKYFFNTQTAALFHSILLPVFRTAQHKLIAEIAALFPEDCAFHRYIFKIFLAVIHYVGFWTGYPTVYCDNF